MVGFVPRHPLRCLGAALVGWVFTCLTQKSVYMAWWFPGIWAGNVDPPKYRPLCITMGSGPPKSDDSSLNPGTLLLIKLGLIYIWGQQFPWFPSWEM